MQLQEGHDQLADFRLRSRVALAIILALSALLMTRLWSLQIRDHEELAERSERNRTTTVYVSGVRGLIYDRNGAVMADNIPSWQLEITPEKSPNMELALQEIAQVIDVKPHELQRFHERRESSPSFDATPLKLSLTADELARLEVNIKRWPGVQIRAALTRRYPFADTAAHLIGYVGGLTARDLAADTEGHYRGASHIGKVGVEKSFETQLRPISGQRLMESDARGRHLQEIAFTPPTPGWDLRLTLDNQLQTVAARALGDRRGAAVALDLQSGEVLALVSTPSFDPHLFINGISHANYRTLINDPAKPLFNRALQGRYPPGSTVKPAIALAGLEYNAIAPHDHIYCSGSFQLPGNKRKYRDWKRRGHGSMDMRQSIAQSCDIYYYQLANELGIDRLATFAGRLGIGSVTGIQLPGEDAGVLPSKQWKIGAIGQPWFPGETLNIGIGQGYMVMTPMQLAQMTARIALRGEGFQPRLVKSRTRGDQVITEEAKPLKAIALSDRKHWSRIHEGMIEVIYGRRGTAKAVGKDLPFKVAGKTGTAQVAGLSQEDDKAPQLEDVPEKLRDHALFIAFAPVTKPEIAVAVIIENSGSGSAVAAPAARKILEDWLTRCDGWGWRPWCLEADI